MTEPKGFLYIWHDEPHITGFLTVGAHHYELVGVRRSPVRIDLAGHEVKPEQMDMFDDTGSGAGESQRDLA